MKYKINNWMVIIVTNNPELVIQGFDITKKSFSKYEDAKIYMTEKATNYAKAKDIDLRNDEVYITFDGYVVQMKIIDCSKEIEIIG